MFEFVESADSFYIRLELMAGGDLLKRIQEKDHLTEPNTKLLFYQICHGIQYLHHNKITHRDVKPENILLTSSEDNTLIKISDFGLSKAINTNSALNSTCGTTL